jgi:selenocysteine lyase/cysteine desulfurase
MTQRPYYKDFAPFDDRIWLNCAHQGPLPLVAVSAAEEALKWKTNPIHLNDESFFRIPQQLKQVLGRLVNIPYDQIILGNSTSYGIHLMANGFPWKKNDEILLVKGDFPANILPWLFLKKFGVKIRFIQPQNTLLTVDDVYEQITPNTRLFCTSWVNSFTGQAIDLKGMGNLCQKQGIIFMVNGSQALGARVLNLPATKIDVFSCCGFKWLCGPYGTGFCWIRPEILESLEYNQAYWLTMQHGQDLNQMRDFNIRNDLGASLYDVFCTANFMNFMPWTASLQYLLEQGPDTIEKYDNVLVSYFMKQLDPEKYKIISPQQDSARSTLILFSHRKSNRNTTIYKTLKYEKIELSLREENLRVSPHLYNTKKEIGHLLTVLHSI